jgi:hypothetical protein
MSEPENTGPSFETLRTLHGLLPHMAKAKAEGKLKGLGRKVQKTRYRKMCKICCTQFDMVTTDDESPIEPGICGDCQNYLDSGMIALVSGDEYAFLTLAEGNIKDTDLKGQIVRMQPERWNFVKEKMGIQIRQRHSGNGQGPT